VKDQIGFSYSSVAPFPLLSSRCSHYHRLLGSCVLIRFFSLSSEPAAINREYFRKLMGFSEPQCKEK
jgi:hypothetical protein